eukprot:EG_transcript_31471
MHGTPLQVDFPTSINRKEFEKEILQHGGLIEQNPKRCSHLLLLPDGEGSKRHQQAVQAGAQVLTLKQLQAVMRGRTLKESVEEAPTKKKRTNEGRAVDADLPPAASDPFSFTPGVAATPAPAPPAPFLYKPQEVAFRI